MSCCKPGFEALRAAEDSLLSSVERHLGEVGSVSSRDIFVEVPNDPVVKHGAVHCLELVPHGLATRSESPAVFVGKAEGSPAGSNDATSDTAPPGEAPPLVMLPGYGMGAASFAGCIELLLRFFPERRTFILDWPASGGGPRMPFTLEDLQKLSKSHKPSGESPVVRGIVHTEENMKRATSDASPQYPPPEQRFVDMIDQARRQLGLTKFVLIGHSIGGFLAFNYAEKFPQHVDQLVLCSPQGVPRCPDALGMSETAYREWLGRKNQEEPEYAGEFARLAASLGTSPRRALLRMVMQNLSCCERFSVACIAMLCVIFSPLILLVLMMRCLCPARPPMYKTMHPHNGMPPDFLSDWPPPEGAPAADYEQKRIPPTVIFYSMPSCLGRWLILMFAKLRFKDSGQWEETQQEQPQGMSVIAVAGTSDGFTTSPVKGGAQHGRISRKAFAAYQYCITAFGTAELNWGDQLFSSIQFAMYGGTNAWIRSPIGRRVEKFCGLPADFEGGSEFYSEGKPATPAASNMVIAVDKQTTSSTDSIPVSFFYGIWDWMPFRAGKLISEKVARHSGRSIPVLLLKNSGHQMFVDNPKGFVEGLRMLVA